MRARAAAPMPPAPARDVVAARLAAGWEDDDFWVAQACLGGRPAQVVGYVRFVRPDDHRVGWLDDLYVLPEASGAGVGTALLDVVKAHLGDGFGLWAFTSNRPARRFYAAQGLVEVEALTAEESPTGQAEVRLAWPPNRGG